MVIDSPSNRYLVLDPSRNVHSILPKKSAWTNSYWDEFVSLPPVVPRGPVALLGLGAGTAAHMMLEVWPWIQLIGWEIDPTIIELSRDYFGMSNLEKTTELGGSLSAETWLEIAKKLMPDGRIMVNCGGADTPVSLAADTGVSSWVQNPTIKALCSAFPGQVLTRLHNCYTGGGAAQVGREALPLAYGKGSVQVEAFATRKTSFGVPQAGFTVWDF
ncbi:hypothetical protein TRIUR3_06232 [Triticum urartu]|uniref:Uncharacterized protein n=1 Tax=Triticum urartu TaxID=4572 RepID=M7Z4W4_TRIUA|nr:hypothetical protein TRIUR3_06232 [Triticum urartu]